MTMFTNSLECDGDCGSKIELTAPTKKDVHGLVLTSVAEHLGWTTRDHGKKVEVYCQFCQKRALRIVDGR